jgi:hypothetical protein
LCKAKLQALLAENVLKPVPLWNDFWCFISSHPVEVVIVSLVIIALGISLYKNYNEYILVSELVKNPQNALESRIVSLESTTSSLVSNRDSMWWVREFIRETKEAFAINVSVYIHRLNEGLVFYTDTFSKAIPLHFRIRWICLLLILKIFSALRSIQTFQSSVATLRLGNWLVNSWGRFFLNKKNVQKFLIKIKGEIQNLKTRFEPLKTIVIKKIALNPIYSFSKKRSEWMKSSFGNYTLFLMWGNISLASVWLFQMWITGSWHLINFCYTSAAVSFFFTFVPISLKYLKNKGYSKRCGENKGKWKAYQNFVAEKHNFLHRTPFFTNKPVVFVEWSTQFFFVSKDGKTCLYFFL